ncbi:MAG: FMN-binding negative transcriptional regulator [Thermomicrobiales bacterium]|nr:FMN-binding negative transcriptional regulator [Thermomicrobiales bacterium]
MYLPPHFREERPEALQALIAAYPLGTLVTLGSDGLTANHIPFLLEERGDGRRALVGHVARNNALWCEHAPEVEALVVFQGPSAYISPNWYPTKQETHEVVPTYNYAVVHVHGPLIVHDDAKWLRGAVGKLTKTMEANQPVPWKMGDAPATFIDGQLESIVGIEILVSRMVGKWKTSQNRVPVDRVGAAAGLRASGDGADAAMANLIEGAR